MASRVIWFRNAGAARRPLFEIELQTVVAVGAGVPILVDDAKRLVGPPRLERCRAARGIEARVQIHVLPEMGSARPDVGDVRHRIGPQLTLEGDVPVVDFRRDPLYARLQAENGWVGHEGRVLGNVREDEALREAGREARIVHLGIRKRTNLRSSGGGIVQVNAQAEGR